VTLHDAVAAQLVWPLPGRDVPDFEADVEVEDHLAGHRLERAALRALHDDLRSVAHDLQLEERLLHPRDRGAEGIDGANDVAELHPAREQAEGGAERDEILQGVGPMDPSAPAHARDDDSVLLERPEPGRGRPEELLDLFLGVDVAGRLRRDLHGGLGRDHRHRLVDLGIALEPRTLARFVAAGSATRFAASELDVDDLPVVP
jgi:hypothetical protein